MTPLRVVFMGTPDFSVPTLEALVQAGHNIVVSIVSQIKKRVVENKCKCLP